MQAFQRKTEDNNKRYHAEISQLKEKLRLSDQKIASLDHELRRYDHENKKLRRDVESRQQSYHAPGPETPSPIQQSYQGDAGGFLAIG